MRIPFWTARRERKWQQEQIAQRRIDAWADKLIDEYEVHRLNEDITLSGDLPYYDSCPSIGDGHIHLSPDWPFYAGWARQEEGE